MQNNVGSINFTDPANIRQVHKALMSEVRKEAIYISNKYKIQIEPIQFEWDKFLPTLKKGFLIHIVKEQIMVSFVKMQYVDVLLVWVPVVVSCRFSLY